MQIRQITSKFLMPSNSYLRVYAWIFTLACVYMLLAMYAYWHYSVISNLFKCKLFFRPKFSLNLDKIQILVLISFQQMLHLFYAVFIAYSLHLWPLQHIYPELWWLTLQLIQNWGKLGSYDPATYL
jgi:hypothetical protein